MSKRVLGILTGVLLVWPGGVWGQTVPVRVATFNIENFNSADTPQLNAARDVLLRVGADVVCVQEILDSTDLNDLANAAGYTHRFLASASGAVDFNLHVGVMSKFPLVTATTVTGAALSGDPSAKDLTRNYVLATIDVPNALENLVIAGTHWKSGTGDDDEFRRSVESIRGMQIFDGFDSAVVPFFIVGDMNDDIQDNPDSPSTFNSVPAGVPASFSLGNDIIFPVINSVFNPLQTASGANNLALANALQLAGSPSDATRISGRRLDYIWHSDAAQVVGAEVYDSADEGVGGGLPKFGSPLPSGTSFAASDHFLVFVDVLLVDADGACCLPGAVCTNGMTQTDCEAENGFFYGGGTDCAGPLDPICELSGACSVSGESCRDDLGTQGCANLAGFFHGVGTTCAEVVGACCGPGGVCREDLSTQGCASIGGFFYGVGVSCAGPLDPPCDLIEVSLVINEVLAKPDDVGAGEFVELFGTPGGSLDGMTLLVIEGQTASKGLVDMLVPLTGRQLGQDGYFVIGTAAQSPDLELPGGFENGSETFLLVQDLPGGVVLGTDLDADNDGVAEVGVGTVIDGVGLVGGSGFPDFAIYHGAPAFDDASSVFQPGAARIPNGVDNDTAADWRALSGDLIGGGGALPVTTGAANSGDGDFDVDRDRDLNDFAGLTRCFTDTGGGPPAPGCEPGDLDADGDIGPLDVELFTDNLDGP